MSKRIFTLISLLMIASLVLAACASPAAPTEAPAPATEAPAATEAPVETEAPAATEPPAATEAPAETEAATEAPAATEEVAAPSGEPIKIAILAPLTGPVPTFGASTRDGALLAIEEWNAKGGLLGRPIEAVVEDSQCTADPAVNAANKVINQDGVKFIIGEVCSSASIPVSEVAESSQVIQISPTSTNPQVTKNQDGSTKEYIFRACFIDPFQGTVGAKFALDNLGAQTAFIMLDQGNDYVRGLAEFFEASFTEGGGEIVGKETYTAQDTDFSAILTKVAEAQPDVLYVPDYYNILNLVGAQAQQMGITSVLMGGDGWDSADLDRTAVEGGYFTNHYSPDDERPVVQDWITRYEEKYGAVPDALATLAYDAAGMLLTAIEEAGTADDTAAVSAALEALQLEAVSGNITIDQDHNPVKAAVILQVTGGEIKYVATVAP
jgi:branched-chain amino acid transport system substrate-binding protein